jgi:hypothetical protein
MDLKYFNNFRYDSDASRIVGYKVADLDLIREIIKRSGVVVLKSVFPKETILNIRKSVFQYFQDNPPSNPPINNKTVNYWRRDDDPKKSAVKRVNQFYSSFYWNDDLLGERKMLQSMSRLKHIIAGLPEEFTFTGNTEGYITYPTITHFPLGGGYLNKHKDPENIQFCVIIASMSTRGEDYKSGGVFVEQGGVKIDIDGLLDAGDIYLINPSIVHGVDPIDLDSDGVQWNKLPGRWTLFPSLIEIKTTQGINVKGLEDLG